jgi:serine/threonine-protein kinase
MDEQRGTPDWDRIQQVFHGALERDGEERARYLAEACSGDAALRSEVVSLLAHLDGGLLGDPAAPAGESPEAQFGEYRILRPLGHGGMGSVYLAERTRAGFTQRVALKLLRRELFHPVGSTPALDHRFARERQILARLEHPGIARLIDGGYGPRGQAYLAMEYVEGESLADFVTRQGLEIEARLELFIAICEAVHYAHQRLVIHRDLKPTNILVPASGQPKLLDFGIAILAENDAEPQAGELSGTRTGLWFTPGYASPEQVRRERATTLSDIYSLGVVLYELLTGTRPYTIADLTPAEVERVVCHSTPERPSSRVEQPRLARRLRGDLDTIVLKALAKEPERRYRSAQDLAEDLRRHLNHQPVSARPDSLGYRVRTFARRHRTAVTGAALVLLTLSGGLLAASWQARAAAAARSRAEAALARSERLTNVLIGLFQQNDPLVAPVDAAFAAAVLERGAAGVDGLKDQPEIQARLLDALGVLFLNLGRRSEAQEMIERALRIRRQLFGDDHPAVAVSLQHLGRVQRTNGRYPEAERLYGEALAVLRGTTGAEDPVYADVLSDLAFLLPYLSRTQEAESLYRQALAIRRRTLPADDPAISEAVLRVATTLRSLNRLVPAESAAREAVALRQRTFGPRDPKVGEVLFHLADIVAMDSSRWAEAESLYREGVSLQRQTLGERYIGLLHGLVNLAQVLRQQRRYAEAESLMTQVLAIRHEGLGADHPSTIGDRAVIADIRADQGRLEEAIAIRTAVAADLARVLGRDHPGRAGSLADLALLYLRKGDLATADSLLVVAVQMRREAHGTVNLLVGRGLATLGEISIRRRQYPVAEARLREAHRILQAIPGATAAEIEQVGRNLARVRLALSAPSPAGESAPRP